MKSLLFGSRNKRGNVVVTAPPAVPLLFEDDFSSGDLSKTQNGFAWYGPVFCTVVTTSSAGIPNSPLGSTHALRFGFFEFENEWNEGWAELPFNLVSGPEEPGYPNIYIRYYVYYPDGTDGINPDWYRTDLGGTDTSDNNKLFRLYDSYNRTANTIAFGASTRGTHVATNGAEVGAETIMLETGAPGFYNSPGDFGVVAPWTNRVNRGRWIKVEIEVESPTETPTDWNEGNGLLRVRMDNVVVVETTTSSHSPPNTPLRAGYLMGYMNSYPDNNNVTMYITDFAVSTTGRVDGDVSPFFSETFVGGTRNPANGFTWTSEANTVVSTDNPYKGTHSLKFVYPGETPPAESWSEQRFDIGSYQREVWVDYKLYIPSNFSHADQPPGYAENNKFFMLWKDTYSDYLGGTQQVGFEYLRDAGTGDSYLRSLARIVDYPEPRLTGTVSTSGSNTLLGTGTAFLTETYVGMPLRSPNSELIGNVATIVSDTELTVGGTLSVTLTNSYVYGVSLISDIGGVGNPVLVTETGNTGLLRKGQWNQIRIGARLSSAHGVSDGFFRLYINGQPAMIYNNGDLWNTYETPAQALFRNGYFLGYLNSSFLVNTDLFIDDIHFYTVDPFYREPG